MKLNKALKIIIACGGFLFVCIFISINAHASGVSLPYIPKVYTNYLTQEEYDLIKSIILEYNSNYNIDDYKVIIFYSAEGTWYTYSDYVATPSYTVYLLNDVSFTCSVTPSGTSSEDFVLFDSNYYLDINFVNCTEFFIQRTNLGGYGNNQWYCTSNAYNTIRTRRFFGDSTPINVTNNFFNIDFNRNYPVYCNANFYTSFDGGVSTVQFLSIDTAPTPIEGHATAPEFGNGSGVGGSDFLGSGADFGASVSQATKPNAPTITNYTWNTYNAPTVDTSTLETLIQSLIDIVKYNTTYIVTGITGLIENLLTNIQNLFTYIGALIEYSLRVLVTNIQNAIQNLYENFQSLVEPIFQLLEIVKEKVEYITEPFDKDEFFHQVDGNHLITACIHIKDYGDQMKTILTNAQERNTYHLNITYPKPDGTSFQTMISFDWLYPLRHLYMPFLWVFTILYLFFSACRLLGNVVGGKS